jgi:ketosteroid isomerase-like protein
MTDPVHLHHRAVQAQVRPEPAALDALLDTDFLATLDDGTWQDRAAFIAGAHTPAWPGGATGEAVRVRSYGHTALVQSNVRAPQADGETAWWRRSDVFVHRVEGWRLVSVQSTRLRAGVSAQPVGGQAPAQAAWAGREPAGDDDAVLHRLNEHYVQAYREADVAWYDAHLAPEYDAVQSDGTLSERGAALARFALRDFEANMREFPVGRVRVRRFGELALIHAENAYTLKDGRRGISRYTDIWHRGREGRWQCVAAHITPHRAPA